MTVVGEFPPGSRVRVRGEEWAVERSLPVPQGGVAVHVQGLTELVRHHKAVFLSELDAIEVLDPRDTALVADDSPGYRRTRLFLETLLRRTPPTDARVALGHRGALDLMPYQLVPAQKALSALKPRLLFADGTGLGKTVEVGILLTELAKRGRARRVLVVAIKSMLAQLQRELWARFTIPLVRLDSEGLVRVQQKIPSNRNPFSHYDRVIVSVDTLKNNARYRAWLEQTRWDVIVVDECHNVANKGSLRGELAHLLAATCDSLVLTSATPHSGKPESFANLMRMLDPTAIADEQSFEYGDVRHLFVRRFKKDVEAEAGSALKDRRVHVHEAKATPAEERALAALHALELSSLGRKRPTVERLLRWALVKAFLSSPAAALESLDERIAKTERAIVPTSEGPHPNLARLERDLDRLRAARALVAEAAEPAAFGKLALFLAELRKAGFDGTDSSARVVVFSERIATLDLLRDAIAAHFRIEDPDRRIARFDASELTDVEQRQVVESFGRTESPVRLLLASDAASEGVNLHYHCSQLFHFDLPWSLIRITQRNGRIDRFGQRHEPYLHYVLTRTVATTADQHVAKRLIEKEGEACKHLGDVGVLIGLYDPEAEDRFVTEGLAAGRAVAELLPDAPIAQGAAEASLAAMDEDAAPPEATAAPPADDDLDLFALLEEVGGKTVLEGIAPDRPAAPQKPTDLSRMFSEAAEADRRSPPMSDLVASGVPSLFADDYDLVVAALRHLEKHPVVGPDPIAWERDDAARLVKVRAPAPFRVHREPFLPAEAARGDAPYQLVESRDEVVRRLRSALEGDGSWPEWHLLWEQHPLVAWLLDALAASYARLEAPVVGVATLPAGAAWFLVSAEHYNRESQPVHASWLAIGASGARLTGEVLPFAELAARVGLAGEIVNRGGGSKRAATLAALVPAVVARAEEVVAAERDAAMNQVRARARKEARRVAVWRDRVQALVDARRATLVAKHGKVPELFERRLRRDEERALREGKNHEAWLASLSAAGAPSIRLLAVFAAE